MKKPNRILPNYMTELAATAAGHTPVAGVDEAGRGPWAGPVVAAAVILDPWAIPDGIADSKTLSEKQRERVFDEIQRTSVFGVGICSAAQIDDTNILIATLHAMRLALADLRVRPALALIDGIQVPNSGIPSRCVIKGDATCLSIAAASIIAKVTRDRMMIALGGDYPGYGFERHKGYGTREHARGIATLGVTKQHRQTFKPIALALKCKTFDEK